MNKLIFYFLAILFFVACNQSETEKKNNKTVIYENVKIDTIQLNTIVNQYFKNDSIGNVIVDFYKKRQYKLAWFNDGKLKPSFAIFKNQLANYQLDFADSSLHKAALDSLLILYQNINTTHLAKQKFQQQIDVLISITYLKFIKKSNFGIDTDLKTFRWFIPRKVVDYEQILNKAILIQSQDSLPFSESKTNYLLRQQLRIYRKIEQNGGFPIIPKSCFNLSFGTSDSSVLALKQYLFLTGDLVQLSNTITFNDTLQLAIKSFQQRMGLVQNGKLNKSTLKYLQMPIGFWVRKMIINLERLRWLPLESDSNYLYINIPEYKLYVYENQQLLWKTNIIVGQAGAQTNIFSQKVSQITFNPYWVIPTSIIQNEIVPKVKLNANYMEENNMEVLSNERVVDLKSINWFSYTGNVPFLIRQKPGKHNALGQMIFWFPNKFNTYLHDTPEQGLFDTQQRAFSHGCIRVENPLKLANFLLKNNPKWTNEFILKTLALNKKVDVKITPKVPIYIVYFTSWVNVNGKLYFRNDLYGKDNQLFKVIDIERKSK